jgi:xylulokinase
VSSEKHVLSIDVGTEGCKTILFNAKGRSLSRSYQKYPIIIPESSWAEQDPLLWWDAVRKGVKDVLRKTGCSAEEIACVSVTGQSPVLVAIDKHGVPLMNAIIWMDRRAVDETRKIEKTTGLKEDPSMMLPKIIWVKSKRPHVFRKIWRFLQSTDYIGYRLTNRFATDWLTAGTLHFDVQKRKWPLETLESLDIPTEKLPEVIRPTEIAGAVSKEASEQTGLCKETPVVLTGIDAYMATVGVNALELGRVCEITGSSTCLMVPSKHEIRDPERRVKCSRFPIVPDLWITWGIMSSTGAALRWFRENFGREKESYRGLDREAAKAPPGSDRLIFLPYMMGERSPIWDTTARGVFVGFSMNHTRKHFARAILEGCAFGIRHNLETIEKLGGEVDQIWSCGGAARSRIFGQIKADVIGKPVIISGEIEAPALGAAMLGTVAARVHKDLKEASRAMVRAKCRINPRKKSRVRYNLQFQMYKDAYQHLKGYFKRYHSDSDLTEIEDRA